MNTTYPEQNCSNCAHGCGYCLVKGLFCAVDIGNCDQWKKERKTSKNLTKGNEL